jgi:hypothetical protein
MPVVCGVQRYQTVLPTDAQLFVSPVSTVAPEVETTQSEVLVVIGHELERLSLAGGTMTSIWTLRLPVFQLLPPIWM